MFLNNRDVPDELLYYRALAVRRELTHEEKFHLSNAEKGFEGECLYDNIFNEIGHENIYVLRDVYLQISKSVTQYDSILVMDNRVVVNEIKNYTGDYRIENNSWYKNGKQLENDPFAQMSRAKGKLIKLRNDTSNYFQVDGDVIFPNDDFGFFSEDVNMFEQAVIRTNLKRYLRGFKSESINVNAKKIVHLIKEQIVENPYLPEPVNMNELKLGLYCGICISYNLMKEKFQFKCNNCGSIESYETHLLRAMFDHKVLFSSKPMTRQSLLHLIDYRIDKSTVYYTLKKHCYISHKGKNSSYSVKYNNVDEGLAEIRKVQRYKDKILT